MKSFIESLDLDSLPVFRHDYVWRCEVEDEISREDKLAGWKEYVEPKKKIEMWKWAHKEHHGLWGETTVHRATPPSGGDDLVRIEGSRIEVEE